MAHIAHCILTMIYQCYDDAQLLDTVHMVT